MGVRDEKRRLLDSHFGLAVLLLFLRSCSLVKGTNFTYLYDSGEQAVLHSIIEAWKNTPDLSSDLVGWNLGSNVSDYKFCRYLDPHSNASVSPSWQGVECTFGCNNTADNCTVRNATLIGLYLSNTSIAGVLPPEIGNLTDLYTLELIGNRNLTGPLPQELENTWLNSLDVHDNAFNDTIPYLPLLWNLLKLDISGNQFTGIYPFEQFQTMHYLQEFSIGDNLLHGPIPEDAFTNKTELRILDISDNAFNGTLPNLDSMQQLLTLDVSGNQFVGPLPDLRGFSTLRNVNLGRNRFTGTANLVDILDMTSAALATVDLSHNQLTGPLPSWNASSLGSLEVLYLDNNTLTGTLDISKMFSFELLRDKNSVGNGVENSKLGIMSLSNNSIEHVISSANIIANTSTTFILQGNPYCDNYDSNNDAQRCYCSQVCFVTPPKTDKRKIIITAATTSVAAVVLILLLLVGAILIKNRRYKRYLQLQFEQKFEEFDVKPTIFSYNELRSATRDFHEDLKLGAGAYGAVYKGVLPSGNTVAVKQLFIKSAQGHDDFLNEVVLITGMKHRNLVNLKGCCLRETQKLLVYEYVDNFDVDQLLLGSKKEEMSGQMASWPARLKICLGVARGLHYLHALAHPKIIHRDIKAGNILLDSNLEPKIADFGLALLFPDEQSHIMTVHIAGTKELPFARTGEQVDAKRILTAIIGNTGYLAPEYAQLGQLSDKVDVYSFGVLCLEIISGRRNIEDTAPLEQVYLSQWAWQLHKNDRLLDLVDPTLRLSEDEVRDVQRVVNLCMLCISHAVERRPSMARIVSILQGDTESEVHVLGEEKMSGVWSQRTRSELGSVLEEPFNETSSLNGSSGKPRRGQSNGSDTFKVELAEIRAR